jgi:hypothetical protein
MSCRRPCCAPTTRCSAEPSCNRRAPTSRRSRHDWRSTSFDASPRQRDELARRFFAAAQEGDLASLEALLAQDVVLHGDGGGNVPALARSLRGRDRVTRTLLAWMRQGARIPGAALRRVQVNGQPGALMLDGAGDLIGVLALEIAQGRVRGISSIVNPDKLRHLGPVSDLGSALRGGPPRRPHDTR